MYSFKKGTWRSYTSLDGLAYNVVWTIYHDSDGMLWFGTEGGGVSRFDGKEFFNLTPRDGLADENIKAIHQDADGVMWFGTWGGGVFRYDGKEFINFTTENGLANNIVWAIHSDPDGIVWFGTKKGISQYDGKRFVNFTSEDGLVHNNVFAIHQDSKGFLWFGTEGGISRYDGKEFINFTEKDGLWYPNVLTIYGDADGILWFGTGHLTAQGGGGVFRYDGKKFVNFTTKDGLVNDNVRAIHRDASGVLWFGTWGGASRYDGEEFVNLTTEDGLLNNYVNAVYSDSDGVLWFGTGSMILFERGGVSRYDMGCVSFTEKDGLANNRINTIYADSDGALWFGTNDGVSRYRGFPPCEGVNDAFVSFTARDGLPGNSVLAIQQDAEGALWFGTWIDGVFRYDGRKFVNFTAQDGLTDNRVLAICCDREGALWFGTWWGGVSRYDGERFVNFTTRDGLANDRVMSIYQDPEGIMWFGTWGGVSRYEGGKFVNFTTEDGLVDNRVFTIYCDPEGVMWFGTWGGVSRYNSERFVNFTTQDGLADNRVRAIYRDAEGILWFGTDGGGVCGYDGIAWTSLDTRDGLLGNNVKIHQDSEGFLWFGTERGVTRYCRSKTRPKARIVTVTTDRRYTALDALEPATAGTRITFEYTSIDFKTHSDKRLYRYKLEGYDKEWSRPTKATQVDYASLPSGEYTFQVQAIDKDLNYSESASVAVKVQPDPRDVKLVALQTEIDHLRWEVGKKYHFENIVGRSAPIKQVYALMEKAIDSGLTVLISGETGTGKELVAKAIHYNSPRKSYPLQELNCGAVPKELVASTLFGYRKGAFTGAAENTMGLFESASGGTVLLDEIGEMPNDAQVHLLRVLQERKIQRIGETQLRDVDVRVIAITNRDIEAEVQANRFREDLYYRLKIFPIHVPPLRQRLDDIPLLAEHFLKKVCRQLNKDIDGFAPEVIPMLQSYSWPGNVRELENEIYRAAALVEEGMKIQTHHFSSQITRGESLIREIFSESLSYNEALDQFRRHLIEETLRECGGNQSAAARKLGIRRPNLIRLMNRLKIRNTGIFHKSLYTF
jgi:DNA-binding NtrC family response regulator/ligand-binding sensor domain-containing protein